MVHHTLVVSWMTAAEGAGSLARGRGPSKVSEDDGGMGSGSLQMKKHRCERSSAWQVQNTGVRGLSSEYKTR